MSEAWGLLLIVGVWIVLIKFVFPKLGIKG